MWSKITAPFIWIKTKWEQFENWIAGWLPGLKTKLITALGAVGSAAAIGQVWLTGIPLDKLVTPTAALIVTTVLFTLAFFFRGLGDRVEARQ